jgi:hypothetical protein
VTHRGIPFDRLEQRPQARLDRSGVDGGATRGQLADHKRRQADRRAHHAETFDALEQRPLAGVLDGAARPVGPVVVGDAGERKVSVSPLDRSQATTDPEPGETGPRPAALAGGSGNASPDVVRTAATVDSSLARKNSTQSGQAVSVPYWNGPTKRYGNLTNAHRTGPSERVDDLLIPVLVAQDDHRLRAVAQGIGQVPARGAAVSRSLYSSMVSLTPIALSRRGCLDWPSNVAIPWVALGVMAIYSGMGQE